MKKILCVFLCLFCITVFARGHGGGGHVSVRGYTRHDGTYVQPHHRTSPDGTKLNNWSHYGNVNPYTGKIGSNTDSSPNYRPGLYPSAYVGTGQSSTPISQYQTLPSGEIHNTRTSDFYNQH